MSYLAVVFEAMVAALTERNVSGSLSSLANSLLALLRDRKKRSSKAFAPACWQHLFKALNDGLANGSLVEAIGVGRDRRGRGRFGPVGPVGRLLRVLLIRASASRKFKPAARKSTAKRKSAKEGGRVAASSSMKKPAGCGTIPGLLVEVVRALSVGGTVRCRAACPKTAPARKRKPASSSPSTATRVLPAAKKSEAAAAVARKKKGLAAGNSKAAARRPKKAVTASAAAADRKGRVVKKSAGATAKTRRKRTAAKKK